jgi:hypothetical protein
MLESSGIPQRIEQREHSSEKNRRRVRAALATIPTKAKSHWNIELSNSPAGIAHAWDGPVNNRIWVNNRI